MIRKKTFDAFGSKYRTAQFCAARGLELLNIKNPHPTEMLGLTEIFVKGEWVSLGESSLINLHVKDCLNVLVPRLVLNGVMSVVHEFNFGFLRTWRGVRIPARFIDDSAVIDSRYTDPLMAQLIQDDAATLRELEEYYSLEDAFRIFDVIVAKSVNAALSTEAAMKDR
jgi:hypothetical protein